MLATASAAAHMAAAVMLGFLWMQSGFLGHDSGHYVVMRSKALNRAVQLVAVQLRAAAKSDARRPG